MVMYPRLRYERGRPHCSVDGKEILVAYNVGNGPQKLRRFILGQFRDQFLAAEGQHTTLDALQFSLAHTRSRYPLMTVGTLATFLMIANSWHGKLITPTELADRQGLPLTTVFRQCEQLSRGVAGRNAMGLIEKVPSPDDGRYRVLRPTLKGLQLLMELSDILTPSGMEEPQ